MATFRLDVGNAIREIDMEVQRDMDILVLECGERMYNEVQENLQQRVYALPTTPNYPRRTGFLRANVAVHRPGRKVPAGSPDWNARKAAADAAPPPDFSWITARTAFAITWGAYYAAYVEEGSKTISARRFVEAAVARWDDIVDQAARELMRR